MRLSVRRGRHVVADDLAARADVRRRAEWFLRSAARDEDGHRTVPPHNRVLEPTRAPQAVADHLAAVVHRGRVRPLPARACDGGWCRRLVPASRIRGSPDVRLPPRAPRHVLQPGGNSPERSRRPTSRQRRPQEPEALRGGPPRNELSVGLRARDRP